MLKIQKTVFALSAAHFIVDNYSSMLGAFLPFLQQALGLSLTQAGLMGGMLMLSSSLMQPLYGYWADRFQHKAFAAVGPAISGIFICSLGLASNFPALLALLFMGGMGIASFHPQGAAVTSQAVSQGRVHQMSFFISTGLIGYALGPLIITSVITVAGLHNSYWAALPGVVMTGYLLLYGPSPVRRQQVAHSRLFSSSILEKRKPLLVLYLSVVIRAAIQASFVSFLPLYLTYRGFTEFRGSQVLTLFLFCGAATGFLGGVLAERIGGKQVIIISAAGCVPLLLGFLWTDGVLSILLCAAGGGFLLLASSVNVVMAQELVPHSVNTVSALMMGFAWGMGGVVVPLAGIFGEFFGLQWMLTAIVLLSVPGFLLSFLISERSGASPLREPLTDTSLATK
ncbi:MAG: MFS transporter [Acidobacteria bacterium]|nr:MFS transporter [Acidobacteriota bacterium]